MVFVDSSVRVLLFLVCQANLDRLASMAAADKRSEKEKMLAGDLYFSFGEEVRSRKHLLHHAKSGA